MSETGDYCLIYSFTQSIPKFTNCRLINVYYGRLNEYTVAEQQCFCVFFYFIHFFYFFYLLIID